MAFYISKIYQFVYYNILINMSHKSLICHDVLLLYVRTLGNSRGDGDPTILESYALLPLG